MSSPLGLESVSVFLFLNSSARRLALVYSDLEIFKSVLISVATKPLLALTSTSVEYNSPAWVIKVFLASYAAKFSRSVVTTGTTDGSPNVGPGVVDIAIAALLSSSVGSKKPSLFTVPVAPPM